MCSSRTSLPPSPPRPPARVIQISTFRPYSGVHGNYVETDPHDALDVVQAPYVFDLKAAVLKPERADRDHAAVELAVLHDRLCNCSPIFQWQVVLRHPRHDRRDCPPRPDDDVLYRRTRAYASDVASTTAGHA